jgi:hypothetical protein
MAKKGGGDDRAVQMRVNWGMGRAMVFEDDGSIYLLDHERANQPQLLPANQRDRLDSFFEADGKTEYIGTTIGEPHPYPNVYWFLRVALMRKTMDSRFETILDRGLPEPMRKQAVKDVLEMGADLKKLLAAEEDDPRQSNKGSR